MNASDDRAFEAFEACRPLMFSIAYRMLGSAAEAEDIVQEAYLRYQTTPVEQIASSKALLTTIVTRLCLNYLQSAHVQRETYIGPWLPEPVLTAADERSVPALQAELHESVSLAFLVLLEQLTPQERAVFLLHEVFDYGYAEIAAILDKDEAACRQSLSRAKKHIAEHRLRFVPSPQAHRQIVEQFARTVSEGDLGGLMRLLTADVVLWADGGGKVRGAIAQPLHGRDAVAKFVLASPRLLPQAFRVEVAQVNGEPALILRVGREARVVISLDIEHGHISAVRVVGNPDKLKVLNRTIAAADTATE